MQNINVIYISYVIAMYTFYDYLLYGKKLDIDKLQITFWIIFEQV